MTATTIGLDTEALLEFHRNQFGDARMEDEGSQGSSEGTGSTEGSQEGSEGSGTGSEGEKGSEGNEELPPEKLRKLLKEASAEAARYRTRLRDAETKLSDLSEKAQTVEDFKKATAELQKQNAELELQVVRSRVASKFSLPTELAEVLKGADEKALTEHAKALAKYARTDPENFGGGLRPNEKDELGNDPRKLRQVSPRRY